jgi:lipid-A-disaccharide synthase
VTVREEMTTQAPFTAFLVAGEESGDQLAAELMRALMRQLGDKVRFLGVGGERMAALGLKSLFPMQEIGLHGIASVIPRLGHLIRRRRETAAAVLACRPDVLITIDCPAFNIGVARLVRTAEPAITTVHYVMPSVWAYGAGRARKMARWIDRVLAILPFEPEIVRDLAGPPCTYVGHPLIERLDVLRPHPGERPVLGPGQVPTLLVLPGSRHSEIRRLLAPFGEAVARVAAAVGPFEVVLPAVRNHLDEIRAGVSGWTIRPTIVEGEEGKFAAFRRAHAALAASGTVTLELALSGVPMIVAYRVDLFLRWLKIFFRARSIVLANLVLGENDIPEFIDRDSSPRRLAATLEPLLSQSPERDRQIAAFQRLDGLMSLGDTTPSARAADVVLDAVATRQRRLEIGT